MGRQFAGVLGLLAFLVIVVRSLLHGSSVGTLPLACGLLFAFAAIGWVLGTIAQATVDQSVQFTFDQQLRANDSAAEVPASTGEPG